jgi:hypothetical protein
VTLTGVQEMTTDTNIIAILENHLAPKLKHLSQRKEKLLEQLAEVYLEEARLQFIHDVNTVMEAHDDREHAESTP